jgi:stage II sporulation protein D
VPEKISLLNFSQLTRLNEYRVDTFSIPLRQLRTDLNLRSTWFSVMVKEDSVILNGRGYGHGVGLCQEGAMTMAEKGFDYKQIVSYYYKGVIISDIKNAVVEQPPMSP